MDQQNKKKKKIMNAIKQVVPIDWDIDHCVPVWEQEINLGDRQKKLKGIHTMLKKFPTQKVLMLEYLKY